MTTFNQSKTALEDTEVLELSPEMSINSSIEVLASGIYDYNSSGTLTGLSIELYNVTDASVEYSDDANTFTEGSPLSTINQSGDSFVVRINNGSGSTVYVSAFLKLDTV